MKTIVLVMLLLCPLVGLAWFAWSLDTRIESGWKYVSHPKQFEFQLFKLGVASLVLAPVVAIAMHGRNPMLPLIGLAPGLLLMKEAVSCWMIMLTSQFNQDATRVTVGQGLIACCTLSVIAFVLAYSPGVIQLLIQRRIPV